MLPLDLSMTFNATLTLQAQRQAIEEWSVASFRPECRTKRTVGSKKVATAGAAAGAAPAPPAETREVVHQQMASLMDYGLPLYKPYSAMERQLLYPGRAWTVTLPGGKGERRLLLH